VIECNVGRRFSPRSDFASVRDLFAANLPTVTDLGASFAVTMRANRNRPLGGLGRRSENPAMGEGYDCQRLIRRTKTVVALIALVLADRGELDWDAPVARYWPEFAAEGKSRCESPTFNESYGRTAAFAQGIALDDVYDWDKNDVVAGCQGTRVCAWFHLLLSRQHARILNW